MQRLVDSKRRYILHCELNSCATYLKSITLNMYIFSVYYHTKLKQFDDDDNDPTNEG